MRENTAYLYGQLTRDPICYKNPSTQELLSGQITIKTARRTNATGELFVKQVVFLKLPKMVLLPTI